MERSELDASPLADLHAIADQIGLDGFRRLRKADLIDAILDRSGGDDGGGQAAAGSEADTERESAAPRRRRTPRSRRSRGGAEDDGVKESEEDSERDAEEERGPRRTSAGASDAAGARGGSRRGRGRGDRGAGGDDRSAERGGVEQSRERAERERLAEGVVELLGNGSAFLRVDPPEPSDDDVYISAAQVRRCELVSGDRVSGPVRTPRRSERYPSLARVDTINGASAETVSEGTRYDDLTAIYPSERLELDAQDPTLKAIEWLTPLGRGSRAVIVGAARAGKTETLRRILASLAPREGLELTVVLAGVRPEEIAEWQQGPVAPVAALSHAVSAEQQGQAVEQAIETAKRVAVRGADAVVLIDSLDGLQPHLARRALAAARNLADGGSLTVIATATRPLGGESTVIALDVALTSTGRLPALDLVSSGTLRPELLVGEEEAQAITRARAAALGG
ncbi:MAG TPA: Rho termination factor N-terminal domain-containing protein [Solirubrobacteraceae bacterium]|jgi:transcription termination factor Rho